MPVEPFLSVDPTLQCAWLPAAQNLFIWVPEGVPPGKDSAELLLGGASTHAQGRRLSPADAMHWLDSPGTRSATAEGYTALLRFARSLVSRGSLRPRMRAEKEAVVAGWRALLDANERAFLVDLVRTIPPAAFSGATDAWSIARNFIDAAVNTLIRTASLTARLPAESWEGAIERALIDLAPRAATAPRSLRALSSWERAVSDKETPRIKLVLGLDPPADLSAPFTLSFAIETRDVEPIGLGVLWNDSLEAHRIADDLEPVKDTVRNLLHKAGAVVAPIEASLASGSPSGARLTAAEAWAVIATHQAELETIGARFVLHPALAGITDRFPKPQVRLVRADGQSPDSVTLATRYRAEWEVVTGGRVLQSGELREAARQAPLARLDELWIPMTTEAGERLARVADRPAADWTGPQALSAALAGEVRLAGDLSDATVVIEPGLTKLLDELKSDVADRPAPPGLKATLRHYQERGVAWLFHRTKLGLGALLADDMGLGKTVQLITLLLHLRETAESGPTLLVCPASLVGNWERELARFAPGLRTIRHHGGTRHRDAAELTSKAGPNDIVLTTYSLVRRDADLLSSIRWGTVVCDEAQNIKNPTSAQSKAVRSLPALRRIALSGTPVENRLSELWGLMEFLNPGLLGPLDRFRREIAAPLERDRDARALRWLRAATAPFMLRRLKSDPAIAPELPEKEIIRVYCSLTEEQAKLYKDAVDRSLNALDDVEGIERSGRVLKLLTDLKQICNHPSHFLGDEEDLAGRSGKLDRAAEMLEEIVVSGERALVFTQYVEMGTRLCSYLGEGLGVEVPFFHGGLPLSARDALVRRFQEAPDGPPILVLSLRAGGVGLNLTRASHVLHYDRWWNPAVEDQATDRAHRIGQTQRVQVHHLITIGSLEERIDRMLEEKRGLADAVVTGGEAWITQLSTDELRALVSLGSDATVESLESLDANS